MSVLQNMEDFLMRHKGWVAAAPIAGFVAPWALAAIGGEGVLMSQFGLTAMDASAVNFLVPAGLAVGSLVATNAVFGANALRKWYTGDHEPTPAKEVDIDQTLTGPEPSIGKVQEEPQRPYLRGQIRESAPWTLDRNDGR